MIDIPVRLGSPWVRAALATAVVLGAVAAVLALHTPVSNRVDDAAWALALAHDKFWWGATANLVSDLTPSLGWSAGLLAVAAVVGLRARSVTSLVVALAVLALMALVVVGGKTLLYQGGVAGHLGYRIPGPRWPSGPATTLVVVGATVLLLLRGWVRRGLVVAFGLGVVLVTLLNGAAEVFLGQHRLSDVVASWAAGLAVVAVVVAVAGARG
jgi:undecaprenyl-diphosphatase